MKPNVDLVNLIALQELATATTPTGADYLYWGRVGELLGRKISIETVGNIIATQIGTAVNRPDRVYQIGVSMPDGAEVVNDGGGQPAIIEDPYLEGLEYSVHLRGIEYMIKGDEWQNDVPGGGFRWTNGQIFEDGQIITVSFQPQISAVISTPDAVARFLDASGIHLVTATSTLTAAAQRKLILIQGATAVVTVTLDATYPEGVLCAILTGDGSGASQKQCTISAPVGQDIFQNGIKSSFYLGTSEYAYLVRFGTRWYVTSMSEGWQRVGDIVAGIIPGSNKISANRQVLQENEWPRLADRLTAAEAALPGSVVSAAQQAANPTRWARGGGQIWVPRPGGTFLRWLDLGADVDPGRTGAEKNQFGSYQGMQVESHNHANGSNTRLLPPTNGGAHQTAATFGPGGRPATWPGITSSANIQPYGGSETRPLNAAWPALIYV